MTRFLLTIIITVFCTVLQAQTRIDNVSFKQVGNNIEVNYDLYCNGSFDAQLFYSTNKGASWHGPLTSIVGDVYNVKQGQSKRITWDVLKDQKWLISDNLIFKVAEEKGDKGVFVDARDNQTYRWVKIGKQIWMAQNLNYKTSESYYYDNDESNAQKYGCLYPWKVALDACPDGWHLPTDNEWKELEMFMGMSQDDAFDEAFRRGTNQGEMLKATNGWGKKGNGTDDYGFAALPGGYRVNSVAFAQIGETCRMWTANDKNNNYAWMRMLSRASSIYRNDLAKGWGFSVRCVRD